MDCLTRRPCDCGETRKKGTHAAGRQCGEGQNALASQGSVES